MGYIQVALFSYVRFVNSVDYISTTSKAKIIINISKDLEGKRRDLLFVCMSISVGAKELTCLRRC